MIKTLGSGIGSGEFKPRSVPYQLCQFGQMTSFSIHLLLFLFVLNFNYYYEDKYKVLFNSIAQILIVKLGAYMSI